LSFHKIINWLVVIGSREFVKGVDRLEEFLCWILSSLPKNNQGSSYLAKKILLLNEWVYLAAKMRVTFY
jgi:hypothetical protein